MKKILFIISAAVLLISLLAPCLFAAAVENGAEYYNEYDEYDNYEEFENDYFNSTKAPKAEPWYIHLSVVPVIVGIITAAVAVALLYRLGLSPIIPAGISRPLQTTHKITAQRDTPVVRANTTDTE